MAYCTQCGAPLSDDGRFCTQCGTAFAPASDAPATVMQADPNSALTVMIPPGGDSRQASYHAETSGIDQFVMDVPQVAVVYPRPEPPDNTVYMPPAPYRQQELAAPATPYRQAYPMPAPAPAQKDSRWPIVVIIISIIVIIAAGAFAAWWFLLR